MEHLITTLYQSEGLFKSAWFFNTPNGETKTFYRLEDEGWELAGISEKHWIWKRQKIG